MRSRLSADLIRRTCYTVVAGAMLSVFIVSQALAINTPAVGGRDADNVRANDDVEQADPSVATDPADFAVGIGCPVPLAYGFDYRHVSLLYDEVGGGLYVAVDLYGHPGDSDQDGGYDSDNPGVCGGLPVGCPQIESDGLNHIFATGVEDISLHFDRNCDGINDLGLTVSGDSFRITFDTGAGLGIPAHAGTIGTGAFGNTWTAAPVQAAANPADPNCGVLPRDGTVLFYIPDWRQYFTSNGLANGPLAAGVSPTNFELLVDSGNIADNFSEDRVELALIDQNPSIAIVKSADPTTICGVGATTRFTITVTNNGNIPLTNVTLTDVIPAGLIYDNAYIDDPAHPIGAPNVVLQNMSWSPFSLAEGEAVTVSFRAAATEACIGTVTNTATVSGEWALFCVNQGEPGTVGPVNDDAQVTCVTPEVTVNVTAGITSCVGSPVNVPIRVTNTSGITEDITVNCTIGGVPQAPQIFNNVPPGGFQDFNAVVNCLTPGTVAVACTANATADGFAGCTATANDAETVLCEQACVEFTPLAQDRTICVGQSIEVPFTVRNCATGAENFSVTYTVNGGAPVVTPFLNVPGGESRVVNVPVTCSDGGTITINASVTAALVTNPACTDDANDNAVVTCQDSDIDIVKTTNPSHVTREDSCSTVTIVVTNTGDTNLEHVVISDCFPEGLSFDETQILGGNCVTAVDAVVPGVPGYTCIYFEPFNLAAAASCTLSYDLCCLTTSFDNEARIDSAFVEGWCVGTFTPDPPPGIVPVTDSDTSLVVCPSEGRACPHTIGFWRQQCDQKGNGSTKVCLAGMENLWRCVITETDVIQWKKNDDSFETTAYLASLSNANLFTALCSQLQGPRPMTIRDMTEIQYLGLMLNVCSGALPLDILISNGFDGTVGAAIDSIEAALNSGDNLDYWKSIADDINNRIGINAADCVNGDSLFRNVPPCDGDFDSPGELEGTGSSTPTQLAARAYPNPVKSAVTTISYAIPSSLNGSHVDVAVFDITGRLVRNLVSSAKDAGEYTVDWDLRDEGGSAVSTGIFFYRVQAGNQETTQKLMVIGR